MKHERKETYMKVLAKAKKLLAVALAASAVVGCSCGKCCSASKAPSRGPASAEGISGWISSTT